MATPSTAVAVDLKQLLDRVQRELGSEITDVEWPGQGPGFLDVPTLRVRPSGWTQLVTFLKNDPECDFNFLADYTATDESPRAPRFDVVLQLLSHRTMARVRVKCAVDEAVELETLIPLWAGANWAEREIWDMFGLKFKNHPDLRRILMDQRWKGHPLRKDYPLRGYQFFPTPETIDPALLENS